jgi:hypothetical protein
MSAGSCSPATTRPVSPAAAASTSQGRSLGCRRLTTRAIATAAAAWRLGRPPSCLVPGRGRAIRSRATRAALPASAPAASASIPLRRSAGRTSNAATSPWNAGASASPANRPPHVPPGTAATRTRIACPTQRSNDCERPIPSRLSRAARDAVSSTRWPRARPGLRPRR